MGCFLPAFNPDVWPPSNPSRRGTVATGSARGLKTWLFTVSGRLWHNGLCFNACHSGRLAALKPSPAGYGCHWLQALAQWAVFYRLSIGRLAALKPFPAGYGCHGSARASNLAHWLQALAQWAVFYRLSIRTFGRPQTLPGGVRLPLALLGASKLGFSPFPAGSGTMGCVSTPFTPDVWPPSNPPRQGTAATGCRLGTMGCFLPAFNPDVWPPSNPSRRGTVATGSARGLKTWPTGCRLWHNGLFFTGFQSGRLAALKPFPAGYGCHWLC